MKILHVTPHLGGGVGKAHAAIGARLARRTWIRPFSCSSEPRDRRFAELIEAGGARGHHCRRSRRCGRARGAADIVQFEFWNHPRLFECLARAPFPAMRSVFWSHISGLVQTGDSAGLDRSRPDASCSRPRLRARSRPLAMLPAAARTQGRGHQQRLRLFRYAPTRAARKPERPSSPISGPSISSKCIRDSSTRSTGWMAATSAFRSGARSIRQARWSRARAPCATRSASVSAGRPPSPRRRCPAPTSFSIRCSRIITARRRMRWSRRCRSGSCRSSWTIRRKWRSSATARPGFVAQSIEECVALLQMLLSSPDVAGTNFPERHPPRRRDPDTGAFGAGVHGFVAGAARRAEAACRFPSRHRREPRGLVSRDAVPARRDMAGVGAGQAGQRRRRACSPISKASFRRMHRCPGLRARGPAPNALARVREGRASCRRALSWDDHDRGTCAGHRCCGLHRLPCDAPSAGGRPRRGGHR